MKDSQHLQLETKKLTFYEAVTWLRQNTYHVDTIVGPNDEPGMVFMNPVRLENLHQHGFAVLMDSTHKTNHYDWKLFTLYVRTPSNTWVSGANFLLQRETADSIELALRRVKCHCSTSGKAWAPRYFVIDQSAAEESGILRAFPGLSAGEMIVSVFYCRVHLMRTLMRKLGPKTLCYKAMVSALMKRTREMCRREVERALDLAETVEKKQYIERNWACCIDRWGMHARSHSPLLEQMDTTNPLESHHRDIKIDAEKRHSFRGCVENVHKVNTRRAEQERKAASEMKSKVVSEAEHYPELKRFVYQMQLLIAGEIDGALKRIANNKEPRILDQAEAACDCRFYAKYLLPCRQMFQLDMSNDAGWFTETIWDAFVSTAGESGFDVYVHRERVYVPPSEESQPFISNAELLRFNEQLKHLEEIFWRAKENNDASGMERLMATVTNAVNDLRIN